MIYRAYLGGKEITGFPIGDKSASEIWGGDTLLWRKSYYPTIIAKHWHHEPKPEYETDGVKTPFMSENVYSYGIYVSIKADMKENTTGYNFPYAYYEKKLDNGVVEFNFAIKANKIIEYKVEKFVGPKGYWSTGKGKFVLENYSISAIENNIYTINGKSDTVILDDKDSKGKYISLTLNQFYGGFNGHVKKCNSMGEAIEFVRNF